MFRFLLKVTLIAVIGFGGYFFFNQDQLFDLIDRSAKKEVLDIPEVGFEEIVKDQEIGVGVVSPTDPEVKEEVIVEDVEDVVVEEIVEETEVVEEEGEEIIPEQFNLAVPFTPQAPHANWSLPYQEACEEASAYMVNEYFNGVPAGLLDADVADAQLLELVAFEKDFLGNYLDTTARETSLFIDSFYGYGSMVVENPSVDQIKAEIAAGRPVIVPAAGQQLGNPNFVGDGPLYHMFVLKGYTADKFITNDPGTKNGENFVYDIQTVMDAMGDWNDGDPANGEKRVIFTTSEPAEPMAI